MAGADVAGAGHGRLAATGGRPQGLFGRAGGAERDRGRLRALDRGAGEGGRGAARDQPPGRAVPGE